MGGWGRDWAGRLRGAPELVEVLAHVEVVPALRELVHTSLGVPKRRILADLDAALAAHPDAEAVIVTTAVDAHAPVASAALAAGLHVLTEKPFAADLDTARALVAQADAAGLRLAVSQNYRWFPAPRKARELIDAGEIGEVGLVTVRFRQNDNSAPIEGHTHYTIRHPLLLDMSVHHFDLMRFLLGEAAEVDLRASNPPWSRYREPAEAAGVVRMQGGALVDYSGSWVSAAESTLWAGRWSIEGERGTIEFRSRDNRNGQGSDAVWLRRDGRRERVPLEPMRYVDRLGSVAELARAIRDGDEPETSGRDNLGTLALVEAAIRSADDGVPVRLG